MKIKQVYWSIKLFDLIFNFFLIFLNFYPVLNGETRWRKKGGGGGAPPP